MNLSPQPYASWSGASVNETTSRGFTPERLRRSYARRTWQAGTNEHELARTLGIATLRELRSFLMKDPAIRRTPVGTR